MIPNVTIWELGKTIVLGKKQFLESLIAIMVLQSWIFQQTQKTIICTLLKGVITEIGRVKMSKVYYPY